MNTEVIAVVTALVGFITGAFLALEAKRAQLEKDVKDSFEVFSNDVEAVVKRIEALEQHVDQKICAVINPAGKS